jgi:iron complex outermembrane receptor protein
MHQGVTFVPFCLFTLRRYRLSMVFAMIAIALAPKPVLSADGMEGIPEMQILKEESESISRGLAQERPISEASQNVYVITDEDIRRSGARDLPTIIRRIPGMEVMQTTQADFNVSVRGNNQLRANKLLVMVDGRSIYLDAQGEVFWKMIPVTLPEIKRIEVLKGPAAVLYGFNAFDGAINIITKSPEEMKGATLQVAGGEFGSLLTSGIFAGTYKKLGYRLSAEHEQTHQWENSDMLGFRANKFNALTTYTLTPSTSFTAQGGLNASNNFDGPIFDNVQFTQKPSIGYAYGSYDGPNFFIRGWWTNFHQGFRIPTLLNTAPFTSTIPRDNEATGNTYNLDAQHAVQVGLSHRLTYGANYRYNTFVGTRIQSGANEHRFGVYLQDEWKITSSLTAVAGVRYDLQSAINPTISPRVSFIYRLTDNHTLRATGAVGYRPPTIDETNRRAVGATIIPGVGTFIGTLFGNADLSPEQIISYELGYQGWFLKHRLRLRADLFYNHLSGLIGKVTQVPGARATFYNGGVSSFRGEGGGVADIYGGEAGVEYLATSWLSGFANFSYQEINQTFDVDNIVRRAGPRVKANAGLRSEFDNGISGEALLHYYGAVTYPLDPAFLLFANPFFIPLGGGSAPDGRVGSYVLLNLRGAYRFWQEKNTGREAEIAVTAFNALNDVHKEHPLGEQVQRLVMVWLIIKY